MQPSTEKHQRRMRYRGELWNDKKEEHQEEIREQMRRTVSEVPVNEEQVNTGKSEQEGNQGELVGNERIEYGYLFSTT
jgi:hypothetical protein